MGCCFQGKTYDFDKPLEDFWMSQNLTKISSFDYLHLIINNKNIFARRNSNFKNLKERFYQNIFNMQQSNKFYHSTMKLIDDYLDISENKQYSILISLMMFTRNNNFLDLYNNIKILFQHLSSPEFFGKGFEDMYEYNDSLLKKFIVNFYKIASLYTFEVSDKKADEELNNYQDLVRKSFSNYMIETKLIESLKLDENLSNIVSYFNTNPQYLSPKDIRIKLYTLYEETQRNNPK